MSHQPKGEIARSRERQKGIHAYVLASASPLCIHPCLTCNTVCFCHDSALHARVPAVLRFTVLAVCFGCVLSITCRAVSDSSDLPGTSTCHTAINNVQEVPHVLRNLSNQTKYIPFVIPNNPSKTIFPKPPFPYVHSLATRKIAGTWRRRRLERSTPWSCPAEWTPTSPRPCDSLAKKSSTGLKAGKERGKTRKKCYPFGRTR